MNGDNLQNFLHRLYYNGFFKLTEACRVNKVCFFYRLITCNSYNKL